MASTNKVIIPLNSVFSVNIFFFSALLKWGWGGREREKLLSQTLDQKGLLESMDSGISAFEDEEAFPELGVQRLSLCFLGGQQEG